jgi:hypothetical protein
MDTEHKTYFEQYNTREYLPSVESDSAEHNTIYTDFFKLDVYWKSPVGGDITPGIPTQIILLLVLSIITSIILVVLNVSRRKVNF